MLAGLGLVILTMAIELTSTQGSHSLADLPLAQTLNPIDTCTICGCITRRPSTLKQLAPTPCNTAHPAAFGAAPVRPASVVRSSRASVRAQAGSSDSADVGTAGLAAIALGLPANAIMLWCVGGVAHRQARVATAEALSLAHDVSG